MKWSGRMSNWINEVKEGDRVTLTVMIQQINKGITAKGAHYLSLLLQDKSGQLDAKYWNVSEDILDTFKNGMIVEAQGDILCHNKQLQFRIFKLEIKDDPTVDLRSFIKGSPMSVAQMKEKIAIIIDSIQTESLRKIVKVILDEYETDFYDYPAAAKNHHAFVGGLASHVLGMVEVAKSICELYPLLQRDLLISGVLLHDIGKIVELSGPIATEYTTEGKLLGHISIMQTKISDVANKLQIKGEVVVLLRHMILAHHGVYAYGSPVLPMIPEAEALFLIDNLDARMDTIKQAFASIQEGTFTQRIFALDNRSFYKAKQNK